MLLAVVWLLEMRILDNQIAVCVDILQALKYDMHTPCVQHLQAVSQEPVPY